MRKLINISIDRDLWDDLSAFAHEQSILQEKRFSTIKALRTAIKTFLRLTIKEINSVLDREPRTPSFSEEYQQPSPGQEQLSMKVEGETTKKEEELDSGPEHNGSIVEEMRTEAEELDPIKAREEIRDMNLSAGKNV